MTHHMDTNEATSASGVAPRGHVGAPSSRSAMLGPYAGSMAVMLDISVYLSLRDHGLNPLEAAGVPLLCAAMVCPAVGILDLMPSNLWAWLLLAAPIAAAGFFNYLMSGHPGKGDAWIGLAFLTFVELVPCAVLCPVWIRLTTGLTGAEFMRRRRPRTLEFS